MSLVFQLRFACIHEMQVAEAGLLMQLFIFQNGVRAKRKQTKWQSEAEVREAGENTSQVASEKEQQRGRPLEIYVIRGTSMTD